MKQKKTLWSLFITFFKIGAFTFGGGYAMIPLIQKEVVDHHGWISSDDLLDIIAIAESTPGPIAINAATFVGCRVNGFFGALSSTFGVVLPSFFIITCISHILNLFENAPVVQYAFFGIRACILALIVTALVSMYRQCPKSTFSLLLMAVSFLLAAFMKINVILVIILCGTAGLIHTLLLERRLNS